MNRLVRLVDLMLDVRGVKGLAARTKVLVAEAMVDDEAEKHKTEDESLGQTVTQTRLMLTLELLLFFLFFFFFWLRVQKYSY